MAEPKLWSCVIVLFLLMNNVPAKRPRHPHEPVDSFRMIGSLPELVAMYTTSDSPTFTCLSATRTRYDNDKKLATYVWHLKGLKGTDKNESAFHIIPGNAIDEVMFTLDNDDEQWYTAKYIYSNYQNCLVAMIPYYGEDLCMLWVKKGLADVAPEECIDQYEDGCDVTVPERKTETCIDDPAR